MKFQILTILVLLVSAYQIQASTNTHNLNHQAAVNPETQKQEDQLKATQQNLQKYFDDHCKGKPEKYNPTIKKESEKQSIKELQAQSAFSIFDEKEIIDASKTIRNGEELQLIGDYTWKFVQSIALWIVLFTVTLVLYIFCIYQIFFRKYKRSLLSEKLKIILSLVFILGFALITWQAIHQYNDGTSQELVDTVETVDCVLLYNSLAFISNQDNKQFPNWSGIYRFEQSLQQIDSFITKSLKATPFKELSDAKTASSVSEPLNKSVKSVGGLKSADVSLTNPDPLAKTAKVNSDFLTQLNSAQNTINTQLNTELKTVQPSLTTLTSTQKALNDIAKSGASVDKQAQTEKPQLISNAYLVSEYAKKSHDYVVKKLDEVKSTYENLQIFFLWNKIGIALVGCLGFIVLQFASQQKWKNVGGNMLHVSWCYGTAFFLFYIFICACYFLFGVEVQGGFCEPVEYIRKDNNYINKIWPNNENNELKDLLQNCVYNPSSNLDSKFQITGVQNLIKSGNTVSSGLKGYKNIAAITSPKGASALTGLQKTCATIQANYGLALDAKGTTANTVATTFSQWADYSSTGSLQVSKGGAGCKISLDQYVFDKKQCASGYTIWTAAQGEPLNGKKYCIVVDGTMPADFNTKRYLAAKYAYNAKTRAGCVGVSGNAAGTTVDKILGSYAQRVSGYQNDVKSKIVPMCTKITAFEKELPVDVKTATTAATSANNLVKSATPDFNTSYTVPVNALNNSLNCAFLKDRFLLQIKQEACRYAEEGIFKNYVNWTLTCLLFAVFLGGVSYATFRFFRLSTVTSIYKSDLDNIQNYYGNNQQQQQQYSQYGEQTPNNNLSMNQQQPQQEMQQFEDGNQQYVQQVDEEAYDQEDNQQYQQQ